ncbi:MAG: O-methyltransferase [Marinifilaceae bacterium]
MIVTDNDIERYVDAHTQTEPKVLSELRRATHLQMLRPRMLSGNLQGQFLKMICKMVNAKRVLEIGTFTGYASIAMAMGMREDGELHTIDNNDEIEELASHYMELSGLRDRIHFHIGDASEVIKTLDGPFDVVFIDADKRKYAEYYDLIFDKVSHGGIIIADDALWDGNVLKTDSTDPQTRGILDFNDKVQQDDRVENVLLPVRHGLMMVRKL